MIFSVKTFGCRLNRAESASVERALDAAGWCEVPFGDEADVVILHTCAVTGIAENECVRAIRTARAKHPSALLIVTGCAVESAGAERLKALGADWVLPHAERDTLAAWLLGHFRGAGVSPIRPVLVSERLHSYSHHRDTDVHTDLLPYWTQDSVLTFVTFRLADSLPQEKLAQWEAELADWRANHPEPWDEQTQQEYSEKFPERIEKWLDAGCGACILQKPEVATIIETALKHFDVKRCRLSAYVIASNHVHVLLSLDASNPLERLLQNWKSSTAKEINRTLGKEGTVWQQEYFDWLIRDSSHYQARIRYIREHLGRKWVSKGERNPQGELSNGRDTVPPLKEESAAPLQRALLKVQDGCGFFCTYCIVPHTRGKPTSRPFEECVGEAENFIKAGFQEIVVTGCNIACYVDKGRRFAELVNALVALPGVGRFRIGSLEPGMNELELVRVMAENPHLCAFLHLPIQSGDDGVLKRMGRHYTADSLRRTLDAVVNLVPRIGLGADIITGFPGENETGFGHTRALLESYPFNNIHIFPYSERPGTPAVEFDKKVPIHVRRERANELIALRKEKRAAFARRCVGEKAEVLVEHVEGGVGHGWTAEYLPCEITGAAAGWVGRLVDVTAVSADGETLAAKGVLK